MKAKMCLTKSKIGVLMLLAALSFQACNTEDEPSESEDIVGKWQKYQVLDDNGNFSEGDLDEFWIFNADGSFQNEDGGSINATGYYTIEGSQLMIYSHSTDETDEEENFAGNYVIDNNYMTYSFTDMRDGEKSTIRFKKM